MTSRCRCSPHQMRRGLATVYCEESRMEANVARGPRAASVTGSGSGVVTSETAGTPQRTAGRPGRSRRLRPRPPGQQHVGVAGRTRPAPAWTGGRVHLDRNPERPNQLQFPHSDGGQYRPGCRDHLLRCLGVMLPRPSPSPRQSGRRYRDRAATSAPDSSAARWAECTTDPHTHRTVTRAIDGLDVFHAGCPRIVVFAQALATPAETGPSPTYPALVVGSGEPCPASDAAETSGISISTLPLPVLTRTSCAASG